RDEYLARLHLVARKRSSSRSTDEPSSLVTTARSFSRPARPAWSMVATYIARSIRGWRKRGSIGRSRRDGIDSLSTTMRRAACRWIASGFALAAWGCGASVNVGGLQAAIVSVDDASDTTSAHLMVANGTDASVFVYTQRLGATYSAADRELHLDLRMHVYVP